MATKAERRAARERVSAYHESQLAGLLGHVGAEIDRYRAGEIDAYAADETIHRYHRAAAELWKFCFARGVGAHVEFVAGLLDRMPPTQKPSTGGNAPHRDNIHDDSRAALPVRVPGLSQTVATPHDGWVRRTVMDRTTSLRCQHPLRDRMVDMCWRVRPLPGRLSRRRFGGEDRVKRNRRR